METREELLKKVMEYKFAVNDLALYLLHIFAPGRIYKFISTLT